MFKLRAFLLGFWLTVILSMIGVAAFAKDIINGAGASFPYPLYAKWATVYEQQTGIKLNYQSIGSGGGIKQIKAGTVDFGASDAPMKQSELDEHGLVQFPAIIGTVVTPINLPGVDVSQMYLDIETISDIYLGKIKKWNDERIQQLNPDLELPKTNIAVIHRSDGSGTTFLFASNLSQSWQDEVGVGKALKWPVGVGGKGNEGVAQYVSKIKGAIGYVENAYAMKNGLPVPKTDKKIMGKSYIIMYKEPKDRVKSQKVLDFYTWSLYNGSMYAEELYYHPLTGDDLTESVNIMKEINVE
ncbi:MAG: phosphate ABC transporter substrate-binding protein PstS [Candidatus Poseidoniales archaeon]